MTSHLSPEQKREIFGEDYDDAWESEAKERWGDSRAWRQSAARTRDLTKEDWARLKAESEILMARLGDAKRRGVPPGSAEAFDLAEDHRRGMGAFYDCSHAQQRGLADMYLADERFTRAYDDVEPGLARWFHDAIHANAERLGALANSDEEGQR